jgi:hypothetical protein
VALDDGPCRTGAFELAAALESAGARVVVDGPAARRRPSAYLDEIVVIEHSADSAPPVPGARNLLWVPAGSSPVYPEQLLGVEGVVTVDEGLLPIGATPAVYVASGPGAERAALVLLEIVRAGELGHVTSAGPDEC